ncbi:uncharacterized protein MT2135-like [Diadema setosum]|uniref:uncharacterized protein MT2135-like n=1 Tax=Diadema setosum TaxID=31175 RepID=UPI003B3AB49C
MVVRFDHRTAGVAQASIQLCMGTGCRGLSADVDCECDCYRRCGKGTLQIDSWLQFAVKTQRELQVDISIADMQIFEAHNAFNNRAYGSPYGADDTCHWPPPYNDQCLGLANQEFSIIDMLNMGVRAVSIDIWWCADAMWAAYLVTQISIKCGESNVLFSDVITDIGQWLDRPGHEGEFVKIQIDEKSDQGHDADVNGPLERYLGHDRILSPADLRDTYGGVWPTLLRMREDGKQAVVVGNPDRTHQGKYIHVKRCQSARVNEFTSYPQCGGKNSTNCRRFRSDATHINIFHVFYDGPTEVGVITDLSEMVKCRINLPAIDMVSPQLMETAVFTWAKGEPSLELDGDSCIMLSHGDSRWYTSADCTRSLSYACESSSNPEEWTVSERTGPYDVTQDLCPIGYKFSVPHNGYQQQKLIEAMTATGSVWLNYSPWLPRRSPTEATPDPSLTTSGTYTLDTPHTVMLVLITVTVMAIMMMMMMILYSLILNRYIRTT